jgi:diaminohydroxyphosphoribosylaminopyrimidine deaminase/5-amino-6-(5-phosphoribosylamino)uracil reductase
MQPKYDQNFIAYALNLAKKNLGQTAPNPVVACLIVKDDEIIASGVTARGGRPHAEEIAINKALERKNAAEILQGATFYITLEPCSHFGATPPCVDKIIKYQPKKVVIAVQDPDERVNGQGIEKLRQAGIKTIVGVREKEAIQINKGFFKVKTSGLPYVTLKLATSLDGKIATKNFDSKWITGEKARLFSHYLRSINDAILVGANTVKKDDPMLDCRLPGCADFSLKRVILSSNLDFDPNLKIFQTAKKIPTIILTNNNAQKWKNDDVKIIFCAEKNGQVDLREALKTLASNGINSVLIEGGQSVTTNLLKENLADELIWIRSKMIIGNDGIAAIGALDISGLAQAFNNLEISEVREFEGDVIEIFKRLLT